MSSAAPPALTCENINKVEKHELRILHEPLEMGQLFSVQNQNGTKILRNLS